MTDKPKTPSKGSLAALRRRSRTTTQPEDDLPDEDNVQQKPLAELLDDAIGNDPKPPWHLPIDAATVLVRHCLDSALGRRQLRRLRGTSGLAAVVRVPGPSWCGPVAAALRHFGVDGEIYERDGSGKTQNRYDLASDSAAHHLGIGRTVVGISPDPDRYLPDVLLRAADLSVTVRPPDARAIVRAIRSVTGRPVHTPPPEQAAEHLDFDDMTAAIRPGSTPRQCVDRLATALERRTRGIDAEQVPPFEALHGYGEAAEWALALKKDVELCRREGRDFRNFVPTGLVLAGESGTGKTMFARAVARSCGLPIVVTSVADWLTTGSQGHLDDVCREARASWDRALALSSAEGPALWMCDELDAIPDRRTLDSRGRDWWTPVITLCLTLVGSCQGRVVAIGATNHADRLDPALVRPGRFERVITIPRPSVEAISGILRTHLGSDLPDADLFQAARLSAGATGADVSRWVRDARRRARREDRPLAWADILHEIAPPEMRCRDQIRLVSAHEAGHAVAFRLAAAQRIDFATIRGEGGHEAWVQLVPASGRSPTREELEGYVVGVLGGRAGEEVLTGRVTGGSGGEGSDLERATALVTRIYTDLGLGGSLVRRGGESDTRQLLADDPALRHVVESDLHALYGRAVNLLRSYRDAVEAVAAALAGRGVLSGAEIESLIMAHRPVNEQASGRARHPNAGSV